MTASRARAVGATAGAALATLLAAATAVAPFTAAHEGKRNVGYHDIAHPTNPAYDAVCYGHTLPNAYGKWFSDAQCRQLLTDDERSAAIQIATCLPDKPLPFGMAKAFVDFTLNVGSRKFCNSSMARKTAAGDYAGACAAIGLYTYSGGKNCSVKANRCGGIIERRLHEIALCESGLKP